MRIELERKKRPSTLDDRKILEENRRTSNSGDAQHRINTYAKMPDKWSDSDVR